MSKDRTEVPPRLSPDAAPLESSELDTAPVADGTQGYAEQAPRLIPKYDAYTFEQLWTSALVHLPDPGCSVLDIGAGSGRDARWFAARGDRVLAVEPTRPLREHGQRTSPGVQWLDATLPLLVGVPRGPFDVVVLDAVWMHLDPDQRRQAMAHVAPRVAAVLLVSLRHGPPPEGRRMFPVSPEETTELAAAHGLVCVENTASESLGPRNRAAGVTWSYLVYRRAEPVREAASSSISAS